MTDSPDVHPLTIPATVQGHALVRPSTDDKPAGLLVGFHGYSGLADHMMPLLESIPGARAWHLCASEGLHAFYPQASRGRVGASWMTKRRRDDAIAANVAYIADTVDALHSDLGAEGLPLVFVGHSQGAGMAHRAGFLGRHATHAVVTLGGDLPPEIDIEASVDRPCILIARGADDPLFTADAAQRNAERLRDAGVSVRLEEFPGGHAWTDDFSKILGDFLTTD